MRSGGEQAERGQRTEREEELTATSSDGRRNVDVDRVRCGLDARDDLLGLADDGVLDVPRRSSLRKSESA